jgi:hypothetical protein
MERNERRIKLLYFDNELLANALMLPPMARIKGVFNHERIVGQSVFKIWHPSFNIVEPGEIPASVKAIYTTKSVLSSCVLKDYE